ncbi:hypothetical protein [Streptomyces fradiae]|nr:hypothetical protein [Streptomyces fradiae]WOI59100.1 hypothetical protein RYQ63_03730 [Streptomyces fradiae]
MPDETVKDSRQSVGAPVAASSATKLSACRSVPEPPSGGRTAV